MLKTWGIYSVVLISSLIFFLCYKMWVSWYCLIAILIIPFLALGMCLISSRELSFETRNPGITVIGDPACIYIKVSGTASVFSFCRIRTTITDRMAGTSKTVNLMIHDKGESKMAIDTSHCGSFSYKMTKIEVFDLFGFFHVTKNITRDNEILVKPIPLMPDVMPDMFGFKAKSLRKSKQPNSEIYDIKEYQAGDPVKSIHWKMSAKKDKLMVKEPLEEYGGHSRIILQLTDDRDLLDVHLGQILFTSRFYLEREIAHRIRVIPPDSSEVAFDVESEVDLERALAMILRLRLPQEVSDEG